jgi:hypothetical protein
LVALLLVGVLVLAGCGGLSAKVISAAQGPGDLPPAGEPAAAPTESVSSGDGALADVTDVEAANQDSTLAPQSEDWYLYTNDKLGFSIMVPQNMILTFGGCTFNEEQKSYRPAYSSVPTVVYEHGDTVYLTYSRYAELGGVSLIELPSGGHRHDFSECVTVTNTLDLVLDPHHAYKQMWAIQVVPIEDDEALARFIQSRYGAGCAVGELTTTGQEGVFDVRIQGDGTHFTESTCPINYATVVKYDTLGNRVAAWDLGQAYTFVADPEYKTTYDQAMVDSFQFLH